MPWRRLTFHHLDAPSQPRRRHQVPLLLALDRVPGMRVSHPLATSCRRRLGWISGANPGYVEPRRGRCRRYLQPHGVRAFRQAWEALAFGHGPASPPSWTDHAEPTNTAGTGPPRQTDHSDAGDAHHPFARLQCIGDKPGVTSASRRSGSPRMVKLGRCISAAPAAVAGSPVQGHETTGESPPAEDGATRPSYGSCT